ncbi:MAG: hypothetical protein WDN50_23795 [Bradyrhizobium sp.]
MAKKPSTKITLIESQDKSPTVRVSAGQKIEVVSIAIRRAGTGKKGAQLATLCGSDDTCVAIIEVD